MSGNPTELAIRGTFLLPGVRWEDSRGDFRRILELDALPQVEGSTSYLATAANSRRGTIRGLHYQKAPHQESKTVWCTSGAIFDVVVDLRPNEPTFGQWISVALTAAEATCLYIPPGVAHGYQTIQDDTVVGYLITGEHEPGAARTISWRDPTLAIKWPLPLGAISDGDREAAPWTVR